MRGKVNYKVRFVHALLRAVRAECTACSCVPHQYTDRACGTTTYLGDEMARLLDDAHQLPDVRAPLVQHDIPALGCQEGHESCRSVDLGVHRLVDDQAREELLRLVCVEVQQLRESREGDAGVVLGDGADVLPTQSASRDRECAERRTCSTTRLCRSSQRASP